MKRLPARLASPMLLLLLAAPAAGQVVQYELTVAETEVNFTGRPVMAMTLNGTVPGPVLKFREGDTARIRVRNLTKESTSIHWHGVLVPPGMDGVPYVSFPPIEPGTTYTYEFPLRQSGTYWYHSHSGLQEQKGVYGSIVIEPRQRGLAADRDHVVLLSDWTDEDPRTVLRTLKRGSDWYALEKGSAQSILGAARAGKLSSYLKRELSRMPAMDIADVAYDRFLANGAQEIHLDGDPGQTVRLRLIDGSATTYFHLQYSGGPMRIISADGQDVEPVEKEILLVGVAETYDVLVTVPGEGAWELRATAHDGSGFASVWIGEGQRHRAPDLPRPDLYHLMMEPTFSTVFALTPAGSMGMPDRFVEHGRFDIPGMAMEMGSMAPMGGGMDSGVGGHGSMGQETGMAPGGHGGMGEEERRIMSPSGGMTPEGRMFGRIFRFMAADVSSSGEVAVDGMDRRRPGTPYGDLRATRTTSSDPDRPVRKVRLTLDGDMTRYVWFMGNRPLSETDSILVRKGETVRFILINRTMMHHPMHLHGHFFRVLNGQGDRAPLKHTVDVAPMSTTVIEFPADETGDWFFHCHLLYHLKAGMARVVHYDGFDPGPEVSAVRPRLYRDHWYAWGHADLLANMTEGVLTAAAARYAVALRWEVGWENVDRTQREGTLTWDVYLNRFASVFAGAHREGALGDEEARGVLGLRYLLPLGIESFAWVDEEGENRYGVEKEFALTPRLELSGEVQYDSEDGWEGNGGLSCIVSRAVSLLVRRHSEYEWGAGVQIRF